MKTLVLLLLALFPFLAIVGCELKAEVYKPSQCDVEKDDDWEIWGKGTIDEVGICRSSTCDKSPVCPPDCLRHGSYRFVTIDETVIAILHVINPGNLKVGSRGILYRHNSGQPEKSSWFQWIEKDYSKTVVNVDVKTPVSNNIVSETVISGWTERTVRNPKRYAPVLIKFKDETMSLGYINNLNEWKLCINKKEIDGGETISNLDIFYWKDVDTK